MIDMTITNEVDETTDLTKLGVLTETELEKHVFKYGKTTNGVLWYGERVALVGDHRTALLLGYVPAVRAAARVLECVGPDPDPDLGMVAQARVERSMWVLFTRHRLGCETGGNPVACGCAPVGDPDGHFVFGATEDTPGAVVVTPVILPADLTSNPDEGESD